MSRPWVVAALLVPAVPSYARAQNADVIRGRVANGAGAPIANASVAATATRSGVRRETRTAATGRYTVTFPNGEGDYVIVVTAIGYTPRQFQLKRLADEEILVGDVVLRPAGAVLDTVHVAAPRQKASRADAHRPDIGGTEHTVENMIVAGRLQGDLNAAMATVAGVTPVPGADGDPAGFSVFGLSPDENSAILNGLPFGGTALPRDANVSLTMATSPYDVSRGAFSGAQVSVRTRSGSNVSARMMSLNVDQPALQWTGPASRQLGQPYRAGSVGGSLSGPLVRNKAFYNVSYQAGGRTRDLRNLLNASPQALQAEGIAPDSVARLLAVLSRLGVPAIHDGVRGQRHSNAGSLLGGLDFTPVTSSSAQTFSVVAGGSWNRDTPIAQVATDLPARGGETQTWSMNAQLAQSAYVRDVVLVETSLGVAGSGKTGNPFVRLPGATVNINSQLADGAVGASSVGFGGAPFLPTRTATVDVSVLNQASWFSANNRHRIKATLELRRETQSSDDRVNRLGTFDFNSVGDVESGRPARFTRAVGGGAQHASVTMVGLSLGDAYKLTPGFQLQYGVRADANRYADRPRANADAAEALGIATGDVPNRISISPRVGFSWGYGSLTRVSALEGAAVPRRAVVRGGVGVFQSVPRASWIFNTMQSGGADGLVRQIRCVGDAVPMPDWSRYITDPAAIPTGCADGSEGTGFASTAPSLRFLSPDFRAPRSVRGNLQWSGNVLRDRLNATFEGVYSRNAHQRSFADVNFSGIARFSLPSEAHRPVYVDPLSIVAATGATALNGSRVTPLFGRVVENLSDLRSESRQLRVTLAPATFRGRATWNVSYVHSTTREQVRGFTSTTGDPRSVAWARGNLDSRHAFTYNLAVNLFDAVRVTWSGRTASGLPFTPMIASDVNGDGYANDRAFIFDPDPVTDSAMASGLQALLRDGPSAARRCLAAQTGRLAARNSCVSGWTSTASMGLSLNPLRFHLPQRATVSLLIDNPIGVADLLLHGANGLRGWGSHAIPDQTLYFVRGFDPAGRQYRYAVNSRFGATRQLGAVGRPIAATLAVRFDIGPSRERQMLTQLVDRGRRNAEPMVSEEFLKATYGSGGIPNPLSQLLREGDNIRLDGAQTDSLATMNVAFTAALDSVWTAFARYAAALPASYDRGAAYARYRRARRASVDLLIQMVPRIQRILTDAQRRQLAPGLASLLDTRYLAAIRSGSEGNSAGGPFGNAAWVGAGGGATGQRTDIITIRR